MHPYAASLIGALLAVLAGALVVLNRSSVQPRDELRAWGGVGGAFEPTSAGAAQMPETRDNLYTQVQSGPPFRYAPALQSPVTLEGDSFDFESLIAQLSESGRARSGAASDSPEPPLNAYSFIPQGLVSISAPKRTMTDTQRALYDYGNEVGGRIQSFEERHRGAPQILKDQFEDRHNPEKNAALLSLARALGDLGKELSAIQAPPEVQSAHQKVAASYKELGEKLSKVPDAKTDEAVLNAILAYNAAAEEYVRNYVSLATLLSAHGVSFSQEDAGSVFTFSAVSF